MVMHMQQFPADLALKMSKNRVLWVILPRPWETMTQRYYKLLVEKLQRESRHNEKTPALWWANGSTQTGLRICRHCESHRTPQPNRHPLHLK